jgi:hypothetical protein
MAKLRAATSPSQLCIVSPELRCDTPRSGLYLECLPLFSRGNIELPNHLQLIRELRLLERRTTRSGKDAVDHNPSGSDDYANAMAGAAYLAARIRRRVAHVQVRKASFHGKKANRFHVRAKRRLGNG